VTPATRRGRARPTGTPGRLPSVVDLEDPFELRRQLTGARQGWLARCAAAVTAASPDLIDRPLRPGQLHRRALAEHRAWPTRRRAGSPLDAEDDDDSPDLAAARAVAAIATALVVRTGQRRRIRDAATHWERARIPAFDEGKPFSAAMYQHLDDTGRDLLRKLQEVPTGGQRGFLALLALQLVGAAPPIRRGVALRVLFKVDDNTGAVGVLRLAEVAGGPPGLHPDPAMMAFFLGDDDFRDAAWHAWRGCAPRRAGACVIWSVRDGDAPRDHIPGGSLGAAFAVGLRELHRLRRVRGRLSPRRLDARGAVTAAIDDRADRLVGVDGYYPKLDAALDAGIRTVVVEASQRRASPPPDGLRVRGAVTVDQAFRHTRTRLNPWFAVTSVVVVALLLGVTLASAAAWRQQRATRAERETVAARSLVGAADAARAARPPEVDTALRLSAAAYATFGGSDAKSSLVSALTAGRRISAVEVGGGVHAVAYSADGKTVVTAGEDNTISLWDVADRGSPRRVGATPTGDANGVDTLALSADGRVLASGGGDETITLWDLSDQTRPRRVGVPLAPDEGDIVELAFSPDGKTLAAATYRSEVPLLWDLDDPSHVPPLKKPSSGHDDSVSALAFSADGRTLVTGGADGTVIIWSVGAGPTLRRIGTPIPASNGGTAEILSLALSPDGRTLATGGAAETVDLWDLSDRTDPEHAAPTLTDFTYDVKQVAFAPDGRTLAVAADTTVFLYDLRGRHGPRLLGEPLTGHRGTVNAAAFAPDGRTLVSGGSDGAMALWDLAGPLPLSMLGASSTAAAQRVGGIEAVAMSADGRTLVATGSLQAAIVDLGDRDRPRAMPRFRLRDNGYVKSIAMTPDGRTLAIAGGERPVSLWDLSTPSEPKKIGDVDVEDPEKAEAVAISRDGRMLAVGGTDVSLWDIQDPENPQPRGVLRGVSGARVVAFSPDGRTLAAGLRDDSTVLWDLSAAPRQLGASLRAQTDTIEAIAFAPDGRTMATASSDTTVAVWDLTDRSHPRQVGPRLSGLSDAIATVAFSPDGRTLATGSVESDEKTDAMVALWDLTDPARIRPLGQMATPGRGKVGGLVFAPDSRTLYTGDGTSAIVAWDLTALDRLRRDPIEAACSRDMGSVSPADWARYAPGVRYKDPCP